MFLKSMFLDSMKKIFPNGSLLIYWLNVNTKYVLNDFIIVVETNAIMNHDACVYIF